MIPTNLVDKIKNSHCDKFEINEKKHIIKKCPSGHQPIINTFKI